MNSRAERASLVAGARAAIEQGSKSFVLASRLFDRSTRERSWLLYAWCRACDDAVDGQILGQGVQVSADRQPMFDAIRRKTDRALDGAPVGEIPFDALRVVAKECGLPRSIVHAHLQGFALDAVGWRPRSEEDLLRYCYHVAGTVGCMMALVMGVSPDEEDVLDRACDLGIAFQLANIARDIAEDHRGGRCYLPQIWLDEQQIGEDDLLDSANRNKVAELRRRLAILSLQYERSAKVGAARLPFRCRWAVLAASGIYGRIAREAAMLSADRVDERVVTSGMRKALCAVIALFEAFLRPRPAAREGLWTRPRAADQALFKV